MALAAMEQRAQDGRTVNHGALRPHTPDPTPLAYAALFVRLGPRLLDDDLVYHILR